jgi:hypothetical protein
MLPRLCGSEAEPECDDAVISLLLQEVLSLPPNLGKNNAQGWSKLETCNVLNIETCDALHLETCNALTLKHVMLFTLKHVMLSTLKHVMLFTLKHVMLF